MESQGGRERSGLEVYRIRYGIPLLVSEFDPFFRIGPDLIEKCTFEFDGIATVSFPDTTVTVVKLFDCNRKLTLVSGRKVFK